MTIYVVLSRKRTKKNWKLASSVVYTKRKDAANFMRAARVTYPNMVYRVCICRVLSSTRKT